MGIIKDTLVSTIAPGNIIIPEATIGSNILNKYNFVETKVAGVGCVVSKSGYTGEDGFELYFAADKAGEMWNSLTEAGKEFALQPCGLACRDTLRLEAGMLLYGQDIDEGKSPLQCHYKEIVSWEKEFVGKKALEEQRKKGVGERLVGFELVDRGIARHGCRILKEGKQAGVVTSGSFSPTLKKSIGLGYIDSALSAVGTGFDVEVRGKAVKAKAVKLPFYRREKQ